MIGRDEIARACREADTSVERDGMPTYLAEHQIDQDGMIYVCQQRAMRAAYVLRGKPLPAAYQPFSDADPEDVEYAMASWMDGFAAGLAVRGDELRPMTAPDGGHRSNSHDSS